MITLFDMLLVMVALAGGGAGAAYGYAGHGYAGGLVGGIIGLLAGAVLGRLPWLSTWYFTRPQRYSTQELRALVRGPDWPYAHLALAELARRGEDIDQERTIARGLLLSSDPIARRHGHAILLAFYPALAEELGAYDPSKRTDEATNRVAALSWGPEPEPPGEEPAD
jgi:hypothetical protein